MFYQREPDEILTWILAFNTAPPPTWWLRLLIRGRFTHVLAFAYSTRTRCWLFVDPNMYRTRVAILPDGDDATRLIAQATIGATLLKVPVQGGEKFRARPVQCCVSFMRHLLNLPGGALSVDGLWRDCLARGAEPIANEHTAA